MLFEVCLDKCCEDVRRVRVIGKMVALNDEGTCWKGRFGGKGRIGRRLVVGPDGSLQPRTEMVGCASTSHLA